MHITFKCVILVTVVFTKESKVNKIDRTVMRESLYIAAWIGILSAIMQAVFLIIGKWDYTVLLGNLLSAFVSILNFLLLGVTVQHALTKEEKEAKSLMRTSHSLRTFMIFLAVALGILLPCFSTWTAVIPIFFSRIAIAARPLFNKRIEGDGTSVDTQ